MSLVRSPWRGWASIIGGALINMTCGTVYSLGNMTPYIVSYIRQHGRESDLTYQVVIMCTSLLFAMTSIGIVIGTAMEKNYGVSKTILCGSVIGWVGMVSSYWSISVSFYLFLFTYGCLFGLSSGWAYVPTVISGMKWFPKRRGLVSGFLLGFYGIGGMAFDFIQTLFINPHNLNPNDVEIVGEREEIYFAQDSVLNRTPSTFLLQAGLSAILQITGLLLQYDPTDHQDTEMQSLLDNEEESSAAASENMDDSVEKEISSDIKMKSLVPKRQEHSASNAPPLPSDISTSRRRGPKGTTSDKDHQGVVTGESLKGGFNGTAATSHQEDVVSGEGLERTTSHDPLWSGVSLSVNQAIRRPYIWQFIAMNAACIFTGVAFIGSYKAYGIGFIRDDIFLAGIGSLASICNFLGHFLIGVLIDHISIKVTSIVLSGIISSSVLLVSVTSLGGKVPFLIVVCSVFFSVGGMFCIQPVIAIRAYGEEHFAGNFILITLLGATVPNILGALVLVTQKFLAWTTMYISFGLVPGIAMFAGMCMNLKNQQGQDV